MRKLICKLLGHKRGFIRRDAEGYFYVCKRCEEIVFKGDK